MFFYCNDSVVETIPDGNVFAKIVEGQFLSAAALFIWATHIVIANAPEIRNKPFEMIWGSKKSVLRNVKF